MNVVNKLEKCPKSTAIYLSGDELRAAWKFMEEREYGSLSWTVRILIRKGLKALVEEEN